MNQSTLIFDLETDGLLDSVSVIHCIGVVSEDGSYKRLFGPDEITEGLDVLAAADRLIGHNIQGYDLPVLHKLHPEWTFGGDIRDTVIMSRIKFADMKNQDFTREDFPPKLIGRHSLESWGHRLNFYKGDYGKQENAWEKYTEEMGEYCLQDCELTRRLYHHLKLPDSCVELEQGFAKVLDSQMEVGFEFDVAKAQVLYGKLVKRRAEIEEELISVFPAKETPMKTRQYWFHPETQERYALKGDCPAKERKLLEPGPYKVKREEFNPNSRLQIAEALTNHYGWKPKEFTPDGRPKVDEKVLSKLHFPEAKLLNEFLMITKRLGMLGDGDSAWLKLEKQGRIYGRINHNGAVSGRCTHSRPNIGQTTGLGAAYGKECRELFTVPPGYKLVGADLAQVELRILAHYTGRWSDDYTKAILEGDIHSVNQHAAGLGDDPNGRSKAKTLIYCTLYGGGPAKIGETIGVSPAAGKKLQKAFLDGMPALKTLIEQVKAVVRDKGNLTGLDGRPLTCRSEHSALNTLLQSGAAVAMKKATVLANEKFAAAGWTTEDVAQVAHIHDELQVQVREPLAEQVGEILVESFREAGRFFNLRCPLDGDYKIGNNWAETH